MIVVNTYTIVYFVDLRSYAKKKKGRRYSLFEMDLWFRLISIINCERKVYVNIKYATCGHGHKSTVT